MTARSISRSVVVPFARSIVGRVVEIWTPAKLFAARQQGLWLEASPTYKDQQVLWQDDAGTTIVDAHGDPVGRDDDLSPNGNNATQATSADRPTYGTDGTLHWLAFDGVGDFLKATYPSEIELKDGVMVSLAVSISVTELAYIFSLGSSSSDIPILGIRVTSGNFEVVDRSSANNFRGTVVAPHSTQVNIFTFGIDPDTNNIFIRINGSHVTDVPVAAGTMLIDVTGLACLTRIGEGFFGDVDGYGYIVTFGDVSQEKIEKTEKYLAQRAGVTL